MRYTNNHNLPDIIVRAIKNDPYDPGVSDISTTTLVSPAQMVRLLKEHDDDIVVDVADKGYALQGQAIHHVIERAQKPGDIAEVRRYEDFTVEDRVFKVGGQVDLYWPLGGVLWDWKWTSVWVAIDCLQKGIKSDWLWQANINAHIFEANGHEVEDLRLMIVCRDWSESKSDNEGYPDTMFVELKVPRVNVEDYITDKLYEHFLIDAEALQCSPDDMWERPTIYAVKKNQNKRAVKRCESMDEAKAVIRKLENGKDHFWIETRPGQRVRCEKYCDAAQFCPQFKAYTG